MQLETCVTECSFNPLLLVYSFTFCCLLACVSEVDGVDGGAGLPPADQVLGLSPLAWVEALGPGRGRGLGRGGGGGGGGLLSGGAVARVPGAGERGVRSLHYPSTGRLMFYQSKGGEIDSEKSY